MVLMVVKFRLDEEIHGYHYFQGEALGWDTGYDLVLHN